MSPSEAVAETAEMNRQWQRDVLKGDLAVAVFLGDEQRVVVRCDIGAPDFGSVKLGLPIDRRSYWPVAGQDLADFLTRYLDAGGTYFWPH